MSFENALRLAIRAVLGKQWTTAPGAPVTERLVERMREESARRDGVSVSADLLDYAMTTDLTQLVERNWEQFKPVFEDKKRTLTYFGIVEDVRNTIAHGREVMPHEKHLIAGAAGQLRLQVSEFQSASDGSLTYYPVIERITDNLGSSPVETFGPPVPDKRLNVGDIVSFEAYASGGRGHDVQWHIGRMPSNTHFSVIEMDFEGGEVAAVGNEVELNYTVTDADVMERFWIGVAVTTDTKHHRHTASGWDDFASFTYAVNPPYGE